MISYLIPRLQLAGGKERYGNMLNTYMVILKEEGFGALYKGKHNYCFKICECYSELCTRSCAKNGGCRSFVWNNAARF